MGTEKRARQKANRQVRLAERQAEETKEVREQSTKKIGLFVAIAAAIAALFLLINVLGGGDDDEVAEGFDFGANDDTEEVVEAPEVTLLSSIPDDFVPFAGTGALAKVEAEARNGAYEEAPPMTIDPAKTYTAAILTDVGTFRFDLFPAEAPLAVNNFVALARDGYYDGTAFHRVLENFMAQAGDPTGTGTGGPGYEFEDEFVETLRFDGSGILAMANAGPTTNGSQFFVTFEAVPHLNDLHTIFGRLANEDAPLDQIKRVDPSNPDPSVEPTIINSIRIAEG